VIAGKSNSLKKRLLFGFGLSPIVALPWFFGGALFLILIEGLALISLFELLSLYKKKYSSIPLYMYLAYPLIAIAVYLATLNPDIFSTRVMYSLVFLFITIFIAEIFFIKQTLSYFKKLFFIRVVVYIGLFYPYLFLLRNSRNGGEKFLLLLFSVWGYDIFAYLFGVSFGKHKFMPRVSPKKSVEGILGGIFGSCLGIFLALQIFSNALSLTVLEIIAIAISCFFLAQLGDLIESYIKRMLSAKDSSHLIPGHGGILDRIDSFVLYTPVFYLLTNLFLS